jgi:hypothetical protein
LSGIFQHNQLIQGAPMLNETIIPIIASVIAIISASVSITISWWGTNLLKQQATSEALIGCFNTYIQLRDKRTDAIAKGDINLIKNYYMNFIDLCWNELRLYQCNLIPYHVFYAWMDSRYRNFNKDSGIKIGDQLINIKSVWDEMMLSNYFNQHDDFLVFMSEIHDGKIKEALREYKKPKLL